MAGPAVRKPGVVQKTWIFQIYTDALSFQSSFPSSEKDTCARKHMTQPCRLGQKMAKNGVQLDLQEEFGEEERTPSIWTQSRTQNLKSFLLKHATAPYWPSAET